MPAQSIRVRQNDNFSPLNLTSVQKFTLPLKPALSGYQVAFNTMIKHVQKGRHKSQTKIRGDNPLAVVLLLFSSHPDTFVACELGGDILVSRKLSRFSSHSEVQSA
jgi:hypothetical protein